MLKISLVSCFSWNDGREEVHWDLVITSYLSFHSKPMPAADLKLHTLKSVYYHDVYSDMSILIVGFSTINIFYFQRGNVKQKDQLL